MKQDNPTGALTGLVIVVIFVCLSLSGCALLRLPFDILGGIFKLIQKLPIPPPWVFL